MTLFKIKAHRKDQIQRIFKMLFKNDNASENRILASRISKINSLSKRLRNKLFTNVNYEQVTCSNMHMIIFKKIATFSMRNKIYYRVKTICHGAKLKDNQTRDKTDNTINKNTQYEFTSLDISSKMHVFIILLRKIKITLILFTQMC